MDALELLNKTGDDLRAWAVSQDRFALGRTFNEIWEQIRKARLYAGQPRSAVSEQGVALAKVCLQIATDLRKEELVTLSCRMLAYSLTADERYDESLPFYNRAIDSLEAAGDHGQAARVRIGYVAALFHVGRHEDALAAASVAEDWFKKNND